MRFIDREKEMRALNAFWKGKKPQLIVVYGKRRVGKTELIKQFIRKKPHIYFLSQKINEHEKKNRRKTVSGIDFSHSVVGNLSNVSA